MNLFDCLYPFLAIMISTHNVKVLRCFTETLLLVIQVFQSLITIIFMLYRIYGSSFFTSMIVLTNQESTLR